MSCKLELEWTSYPLIERPFTSFLLVFFLLLLSLLMWQLVVVQWSYPLFYIGGMLLIIGNLLPYFTPTKYMIYDDKILIKYILIKVERKYTDFGCFYSDKRGIMLSTFKTPRRLDVFRGQSLRYSSQQSEKEMLIKLLTEKVGKQF